MMRPKIIGFDHVALEIKDIEEALHFYTKILGLEEMQTPEEVKAKGVRWIHLPGNQSLHIVETEGDKIPETGHLAIMVEEVDAWEKYLKEHDINTHPPKFDLYKAKRIFFKDPSGNRIEFVKWL